MSPKRGDRAAPPATDGRWELKFARGEAAKGWEELCDQAPNNLFRAWDHLTREPTPTIYDSRHHRMRGELSSRVFAGRDMPQWQYEVTGGGRLRYLIDDRKHTLWLWSAGPGHPKDTE